MQVAAVGVDAVLFDELIDSEVVVTNSRGIFEHPIAEYVLGQILAFAKDFRRSARAQEARRRQHLESDPIAGATVAIVGAGPVGRAIARLLRTTGMQVRGVGPTTRTDPDFGEITSDLPAAVADAGALMAALQARRIAGVALDVVDPEPLPPGHPLWTFPNVVVNQHSSGDAHGWTAELRQQFIANFRRYRSGQPLHNVVDKEERRT